MFRFRRHVSLIQGVFCIKFKLDTNSYSPNQYSKSGEKMKHSLADSPFSGIARNLGQDGG